MWIKGGYVEGKTKTVTGWILLPPINIQTNTHTHNILFIAYCLLERNIQKLHGGFMLIINWFVTYKVTRIKKYNIDKHPYNF